jgi:hypothetical protein
MHKEREAPHPFSFQGETKDLQEEWLYEGETMELGEKWSSQWTPYSSQPARRTGEEGEREPSGQLARRDGTDPDLSQLTIS